MPHVLRAICVLAALCLGARGWGATRETVVGDARAAVPIEWTSLIPRTSWSVAGVNADGSCQAPHPTPWCFDGDGFFAALGFWDGSYQVIGDRTLRCSILHHDGQTDAFTIVFTERLDAFVAYKDDRIYRSGTLIERVGTAVASASARRGEVVAPLGCATSLAMMIR